MLHLCDNQVLLKAVKLRWVFDGGKATLAGAQDIHILQEEIEELRKRTTAGAATFVVKVKAHRGEPVNVETNIQAQKAISSKDVYMEWHNSLHMARAALERGYGEQWRSKVDAEQRGAEGDQTKISRRGGAQAPGLCDRSLETNQQIKTTS